MYQRPYSWTLKEVDTLLGDLLTGYAPRSGLEGLLTTNVPRSGLSLGTLVMFPGAVPGHFWVMDGQQRLTTLALVLAFGMHWAHSAEPRRRELYDILHYMMVDPAR